MRARYAVLGGVCLGVGIGFALAGLRGSAPPAGRDRRASAAEALVGVWATALPGGASQYTLYLRPDGSCKYHIRHPRAGGAEKHGGVWSTCDSVLRVVLLVEGGRGMTPGEHVKLFDVRSDRTLRASSYRPSDSWTGVFRYAGPLDLIGDGG